VFSVVPCGQTQNSPRLTLPALHSLKRDGPQVPAAASGAQHDPSTMTAGGAQALNDCADGLPPSVHTPRPSAI
jgi:hypothetical protein